MTQRIYDVPGGTPNVPPHRSATEWIPPSKSRRPKPKAETGGTALDALMAANSPGARVFQEERGAQRDPIPKLGWEVRPESKPKGQK